MLELALGWAQPLATLIQKLNSGHTGAAGADQGCNWVGAGFIARVLSSYLAHAAFDSRAEIDSLETYAASPDYLRSFCVAQTARVRARTHLKSGLRQPSNP
jgi:hypothetical protein